MKQGDALLPLLINFALEYTIRRALLYQDGLKWNGTHKLLFYANCNNILDGSVHTIKKKTGSFVVDSKEMRLQVNVGEN